jgi:GTP-binding protein
MNSFALGEAVRLVDLPGYGYARVPKNLREYWDKTMNNYLSTRESLTGLVLITDIRRELCDSDRLLLEWCQAVDLPVHVLLNKADKMSRGASHGVLQKIKKGSKSREVSVQLFSVLKKTGIDELRNWITAHLLDRR